MEHPPRIIVFEGHKYGLSGRYYRRYVWGSPGPSNLHRAIWESAHGSIPAGFEVHHKDGNPFNNELSNLQLWRRGSHQSAHTQKLVDAGILRPPSPAALARATEWHGSEAGLAWHRVHGKKAWKTREWVEVSCIQCGQLFCTPYPTRAKYCHPNCKQNALRARRGQPVGVRPH